MEMCRACGEVDVRHAVYTVHKKEKPSCIFAERTALNVKIN